MQKRTVRRIFRLLSFFLVLLVPLSHGLNSHSVFASEVQSGLASDTLDIRLGRAELWTTTGNQKQNYGVVLTGDVDGTAQFSLEYDSSLSEGDGETDPWVEAFKELNIGGGGLPSVEFAGPWRSSAMTESTSIDYGKTKAELGTGLLRYGQTVSGVHLGAKTANMELNAFSGTMKQDATLETIPVLASQTRYRLSHEDIIPGTEMVQVQVYQSETDKSIIDVFYPEYFMNYALGEVQLDQSALMSLGAHPAYLVVGYEFYSPSGLGHSVSGGRVAISRGELQASVGYLRDSDLRAPKELLSLGGTLGNSTRYVRFENAFSLQERESPTPNNSGAWSVEAGLALTDSLSIAAKGFDYGSGFPDLPESEHKPGESGWSLDTFGRWDNDEVATGFGLTEDNSYTDYAGTLLSQARRISWSHGISLSTSIGLGYTDYKEWAPNNKAYAGERGNDTSVSVTHTVNSWSYGANYGFGKKSNSTLGNSLYEELNTRFYGADLAKESEDGFRVYTGIRREDSWLPDEDVVVNRRDSLLVGLTEEGENLRINGSASVYQNTGAEWEQPFWGSDVSLSLGYSPSLWFSMLGNVSFSWFNNGWEWQGDMQATAAVLSNVKASLDLSRKASAQTVRLGTIWYPGHKKGTAPYLSQVQGAYILESNWGELTRSYQVDAEVRFPGVGGLIPSYEKRLGPGLERINSYNVTAYRDLSERYRVSGQYESRLGSDVDGAPISQWIAGVKGQYRISPELAMGIGYSFGHGISQQPLQDASTGLWIGFENKL